MKLARLAVVLSFVVLAMPVTHASELTIDKKAAAIIELAVPGNQLLAAPFPSPLLLSSTDGIAEPYQRAAQSRVQEILLAEMDEVRAEQRQQLGSVLISVFTRDEIEALYIFLSSPAGRSIAGKRELLGAKISTTLGSNRMPNYERVQAAIAEDPELQRLRQLSHSGK